MLATIASFDVTMMAYRNIKQSLPESWPHIACFAEKIFINAIKVMMTCQKCFILNINKNFTFSNINNNFLLSLR